MDYNSSRDLKVLKKSSTKLSSELKEARVTVGSGSSFLTCLLTGVQHSPP